MGEIQDMIGNDPSKLISSIARDMGVSEFLIRQMVHEDVLYFSCNVRKDQFLSQAIKGKTKYYTTNLFTELNHHLQSNMLWFFTD